MKYELDKTSGSARRGRLVFERPQGTFSVETPAFMPVGTYGTVKGMTPEEVRATGNSYIAHINAADRRIVHRVAQEYSDIRTYSEGEGRDRRIIIAQASS